MPRRIELKLLSRSSQENQLLKLLRGSAFQWSMRRARLSFGTAKTLSAVGAEPLRTREGRPVLLTTLAPGKPMVVNLWASWCPPCRREVPLLAKAQLQHGDVTFVFANQRVASVTETFVPIASRAEGRYSGSRTQEDYFEPTAE